MKKEINFRIIELPKHQVLLTKDFDEDEESSPLLVITFFISGVKVSQKMGYADEKKRDKYFNECAPETVQSIVDNTIKMFK